MPTKKWSIPPFLDTFSLAAAQGDFGGSCTAIVYHVRDPALKRFCCFDGGGQGWFRVEPRPLLMQLGNGPVAFGANRIGMDTPVYLFLHVLSPSSLGAFGSEQSACWYFTMASLTAPFKNTFAERSWSPWSNLVYSKRCIRSAGTRASKATRVFVLIGSSLVCNLGLGIRHGRRRGRTSWKSMAIASSRIELLVDADAFNIEMIRSAISSLEQGCRYQVHTTLFLEPGRLQNKTWAKFLREPGIGFQAVHRRSVELEREPNDEAIVHAMGKLSGRSDVHTLALLTADMDFVGPVSELQELGHRIIVLVQANNFGLFSSYKRTGAKVVGLASSSDTRSKVSAVLHLDGTGSVQLGPTQEPAYETFVAQEHEVVKLLRDLRYTQGERSFVNHACAKFWIANGVGSLTVYPHKSLVAEVHGFVTQRTGKRSWKCNSGKSVYFLPATNPGRLSARQVGTYGNHWAEAVYQAGGPFMLEDSPDLTVEALTKLGFLDNDLNSDLPEAMFVFANVSTNKQKLRKLRMLPGPDEKDTEVSKKLHSAFVSTKSNGMWQMMKKQASTMQRVMQILKKANLIPRADCSEYSCEEIFAAMKAYANQRQLPRMQTFNGLRFRILRHDARRAPNMRREADFARR